MMMMMMNWHLFHFVKRLFFKLKKLNYLKATQLSSLLVYLLISKRNF
jgi:hypothetical protein